VKPSPTAAVPTLSELAESLSDLLDRYAAGYERLLLALGEQEAALRQADGAGVERVAKSQAEILAGLRKLDEVRCPLVNAAAAALPSLMMNGRRTTPITLREIAGSLPVAGSESLRTKAARVRRLAEDAQQRSRVVAGATRAMLGHAEGLLRHVAQKLSHAGTYSASGTVQAGRAVVSSLDLRS